MFWNLGPNAVNERLTALFLPTLSFISGHQQSIPALFHERLLYTREHGVKAYGAFAYFVSSMIFGVPIIALQVLIFSAVQYPMCGFRSGPGHFGLYFLVYFLLSFTGYLNCMALACFASSAQTAIQLFPIVFLFQITFSGFIIFIPTFPLWLRAWGPYISYIRFGYQTLVVNELDGNNQVNYSQEYLNMMGFESLSISQCWPIIFIFDAIFVIGAIVCLKYMNYEKR